MVTLCLGNKVSVWGRNGGDEGRERQRLMIIRDPCGVKLKKSILLTELCMASSLGGHLIQMLSNSKIHQYIYWKMIIAMGCHLWKTYQVSGFHMVWDITQANSADPCSCISFNWFSASRPQCWLVFMVLRLCPETTLGNTLRAFCSQLETL